MVPGWDDLFKRLNGEDDGDNSTTFVSLSTGNVIPKTRLVMAVEESLKVAVQEAMDAVAEVERVGDPIVDEESEPDQQKPTPSSATTPPPADADASPPTLTGHHVNLKDSDVWATANAELEELFATYQQGPQSPPLPLQSTEKITKKKDT